MMNYKRLICLLAIANTHTWIANGSSLSSVSAKHGKTSSKVDLKGATKARLVTAFLERRRVECDPDHPEECPKHVQEHASSEEHQDSNAASSGSTSSSQTTSGGTGTSTSTSSASSGTNSSSSSKYSKNSGSSNNGGTGNVTVETNDSKFAWSSVLLIGAAAVAAALAVAKKRNNNSESDNEKAISFMDIEAATSITPIEKSSSLVPTTHSLLDDDLSTQDGSTIMPAASTPATVISPVEAPKKQPSSVPLKTRAISKAKELSGRFRGFLSKKVAF